MVERVYGRIPVDEQARLLASELGEFSLPYFSLNPVQNMDETDELDSVAGNEPEPIKQKTPQKAGFFGAQRRNRTADTRIFKRFASGRTRPPGRCS